MVKNALKSMEVKKSFFKTNFASALNSKFVIYSLGRRGWKMIETLKNWPLATSDYFKFGRDIFQYSPKL